MNSSSQGSVSWVNPKCKAKDELLHGECRKELVCAPRFLTVSLSCCRHFMSRIPTCVHWSLILSLILCHLLPIGFQNPCLIGFPKKEAQSVKYNYIRRFLPTLGEVLRVDTTEAQSLSNWIEIAHGRDRREASASHPTSRHYAGDKLMSSGLVKAMCALRHFVRWFHAINVIADNPCYLLRGLMYGWPCRTLTRPGNMRCMV